MSRRHLANFRWHIPYHRLVNTSRATLIHPRYFSSYQHLRRADHYAVLGVSKNATPEQILRAFRRESLKKHPDVNKSPDAHTEFQALSEAKDALIASLEAREDADRKAAEELRKRQEEWTESEARKRAKEDADRIAAEQLRKQHQEWIEREERKIARHLEKKSERKTHRKATKKAASQDTKRKRALQAAKEREHARWEANVQKESMLEYAERVKAAREDSIATQNFRKKGRIAAYALFGVGAVAFLLDVFWGAASEGEDGTSQEKPG